MVRGHTLVEVDWDAVTIPITTRLVTQSHSSSGPSPLIVTRTFDIGTAMIRCTLALAGAHGTTVPAESELERADLLEIAVTVPGHAPMVTEMRGAATDAPRVQYEKDAALFDVLWQLQAHAVNSLGYFSILKGARFSHSHKARKQADLVEPILYRRLAAMLRHLGGRYAAIVATHGLRQYYNARRPGLLMQMQSMLQSARQHLLFAEEEHAEIAAIIAESSATAQQALADFRWNGTPLTRGEFYRLLATTEEASARERLVREYSGAVLSAYQQALFPALPRLNAVARTHGFANYPAYVGAIQYDLPPARFLDILEAYHLAHDRTIAGFVDTLRTLLHDARVHEWDVHYLANKKIRMALGGGELPTLTFTEALHAAQAFYRDLGIDFAAAPLAQAIHYDTKKREDKYGNAFVTRLGAGNTVWMHTNFAPDAPLTLADLQTLVHELAHAAHILLSAEEGHGNGAMGMAATPKPWREGIASALDQLVVSRAWMDRYLSPLSQFADPDVRRAMAGVHEPLARYDTMLTLLRAAFEMGWYDDGPLTERLNRWPTLAAQYLHVAALPGTAGGRIYATPHFATSPGYYVVYGGGLPLATRVTAPIATALAHDDTAALQRQGKMLIHLLRQGVAFSTLQAIEQHLADIEKTP
ncbi:MAG: hypothetical protein HYV02_05630 [Deltaproteobacteria bacterium]|nr:hypothetical protein [Deltaproteobacteria bacterium]